MFFYEIYNGLLSAIQPINQEGASCASFTIKLQRKPDETVLITLRGVKKLLSTECSHKNEDIKEWLIAYLS